jgi:hypothetical protein
VEKKEQEEQDYNSIPDHSFDLIQASLACILSAIHQAAPQSLTHPCLDPSKEI